jgi:hypothetical protein
VTAAAPPAGAPTGVAAERDALGGIVGTPEMISDEIR